MDKVDDNDINDIDIEKIKKELLAEDAGNPSSGNNDLVTEGTSDNDDIVVNHLTSHHFLHD